MNNDQGKSTLLSIHSSQALHQLGMEEIATWTQYNGNDSGNNWNSDHK